MTWGTLLHSFAVDDLLKAVALLILADVLLGVTAAIVSKTQRFDFQRVTDFLIDDVIGKVFPWFIVYSIAKVAPNTDVLGIDFNDVQHGVFALVVLALVASMMTSLMDLGLKPLAAIPGIGPSRPE